MSPRFLDLGASGALNITPRTENTMPNLVTIKQLEDLVAEAQAQTSAADVPGVAARSIHRALGQAGTERVLDYMALQKRVEDYLEAHELEFEGDDRRRTGAVPAYLTPESRHGLALKIVDIVSDVTKAPHRPRGGTPRERAVTPEEVAVALRAGFTDAGYDDDIGKITASAVQRVIDASTEHILALLTPRYLDAMRAIGVYAADDQVEEQITGRDVYAAWCLALRHRFHDNHPASGMSLFQGPAPAAPKDFAFLTHIEQFAWEILADSINHNDSVTHALQRDRVKAQEVAKAADGAFAKFKADVEREPGHQPSVESLPLGEEEDDR